MKVQYILPFVLLAIVSCKQNESIFNEDNNKAIFSGSIHQMQTRVSGTSWDANDTIGICMVATGTNTISNGIDNYAYVTTGDGYFSPSSEEQTIYYPLDKSTVDFVAYYPYRNWAGSCFYVANWNSTRQDTLDLLVANVSNKSQKDPEAELSFYHQFSKLVLNISTNSETGLTDADLAGMTVSIAGINKPAHCILLNKTVEYGESLAENVYMKVSADGKSASAIIPSTTGSSVNFTLADGSTYTWDISAQSFESGKLYPYAITLKAAPNYVEATLGSVINDWNAVDSTKVNLDQDTIVDHSGTLNGHDYVDLGLPSGTMWATCNVGASSPEEYGNYYAWGETATKESYDWSTYKYFNAADSTMTKYCSDSDFGVVDNLTTLESSDDAAATIWGREWKMPTKTQWIELCSQSYCTWTWCTLNNVNGYKITGSNGNYIFLPAAGFCDNANIDYAETVCNYWSSSLSVDNENAYHTFFYSSNRFAFVYVPRYYGQSIRAVRSE